MGLHVLRLVRTDGDLLGIVTTLGQILVMTDDWDLLYENALEDQLDGVDVR